MKQQAVTPRGVEHAGLFDTLRPPCNPAASEHAGVVVDVRQRWENADGSATVILALADGETARGRLESGESLVRGSEALFLGAWREHPRWGWQFAFDSFVGIHEEPPAAALVALARYLAQTGRGAGR